MTAQKERKLQSALSQVGRTVLSVGLLLLLVLLFWKRLGQAWGHIGRADCWWLAVAVGWFIVFIIVSAWRWRVLLAAQGLNFSTWYLAKVFTLGLFFCKLLPTSIGGDVFRIAWTSRKGKGAEAFSATLLDRLIGFLSLTFLAVVVALALFGLNVRTRELEVVALGIRFRGLGIVGLLTVLLAALVALTLIFFNDACHRLAVRLFGGIRFLGIGRLLDRVYEAVKRFRNEPAALAASFVSGIGVQAALALSWFSVARALDGRVGLIFYLVLIPILNIVVNLPTIGGLGVREWAFVLLFTPGWLPGRLSAEQALATALLFLVIDLGFALLGGVLFAVMRRQGSDVLSRASAVEQKEESGVTGCKTESRGGPAL